MRFRIRHAKGLTTISDLTAEQTVSELKRHVAKAINLAPSQDIESKFNVMGSNILLNNPKFLEDTHQN